MGAQHYARETPQFMKGFYHVLLDMKNNHQIIQVTDQLSYAGVNLTVKMVKRKKRPLNIIVT